MISGNIPLRQVSLLCVEDEKQARKELETMLSAYVPELYMAENGIKGLELYKEHRPDIVLSDIQMPGMNGLAMSAEIREIDSSAIVVLMTAYSDESYLMRALELGANSYILKPIVPTQLARKLGDLAKKVMFDRQSKEREKKQTIQMQYTSKMELLKEIAHHWRQPLSVVQMSLSNLMDEWEEQAEVTSKGKRYFEKISQTVETLSHSIDRFAKLYRVNNPGDIKVIELKELVEQAIEVLKPVLDSEGFEADVSIPEGLELKCNISEMALLIKHLIQNSIDAKRRAHISHPRLSVRAEKSEEGFLLLELSDNCGGIPQNIIERVKEPYITSKFNSQGTGLGLFLVEHYISEHLKGSLTLENDGDGCLNRLRIPIF